MKITLLWMGKTTDKHIESLVNEYMQRLTHYAEVELKILQELRNTKALSIAVQKQQEGEMILRALPENADVVLLDEHGTEFRSVELAAYMQKKIASSRPLIFVIGGPFGFSEQVYGRANGQLSLSRLTFSHQMIRLLFVEQLYRAFTIIRGEKYHHE